MKRLHGLTLRMLPGPFFGWLATLLFLLLMQFLIEELPQLAGKGLSFSVIAEVIAYSLAYMLVLAVPMSVLLATLMAFGALAESNAYAAIKSSGISLGQLVRPALLVGLCMTGAMLYFNNVVLPEANFRAKNLWRDIRVKKPGFALQPGVFYEELDGYSILVQETNPDSNLLSDVTIYDYTDGLRRQTIIKAARGKLRSNAQGTRLHLTLYDGEIHRLRGRPGESDRYERLRFGKHRLTLDLNDVIFERNELRKSYRSDRTTPTVQMIRRVDSMEVDIAAERERIRALTRPLLRFTPAEAPPADSTTPLEAPSEMPSEARSEARSEAPPRPAAVPARLAALSAAAPDSSDAPADSLALSPAGQRLLDSLSTAQRRRLYVQAIGSARTTRSSLDDVARSLKWTAQRANSYRVEIYKKNSMAVACFMFVLIGIPLGLSMRRGSLGAAGAAALGIFLFYWVTLVLGEKAADRGALEPWLGMWIANVVMLFVGSWLMAYVAFDLRATPPLHKRLLERLKGFGFGV